MEYSQALEYIAQRSGYDRGFIQDPFAGDDAAQRGLLRTDTLLSELERPQDALRIVHVAGTKGKGSTSATVATIGHAAGRKVGLCATPHLHSFRERIQVDLASLGEFAFGALVETGRRAVDRTERDRPELGEITAFELVTALALRAFAEAGVELAVVEVGLGGRLDATNVVRPTVSVITSISLDHTAILGDTLPEIAFEKAGIIKPGVPVVVGPQPSEALAVIEEVAARHGSRVLCAGIDWTASGNWRSARFEGPWGVLADVELALAGAHQVENAGVALAALSVADGDALTNLDLVSNAMRQVRWPARFEVVEGQPLVIIDGAHNDASIERLVETFQAEFPARRNVVLLGMSRDKDAAGILAALASLDGLLFSVQSDNPRAVDARELSATARSNGIDARAFERLEDALAAARDVAGRDGVILITGSLYLAAEARETLGLARTAEVERRLLYG